MLGDLTIGQQQLIATARATVRGTKFLIFDEPTAYLTRKETDQLFTLIRRLKGEGVTIIYISHRMEEVFEARRPCLGAARRHAGRHQEHRPRPTMPNWSR